MAEISDLFSEFSNAPPKEKFLIVGVVVAVGGIAYYTYRKQKASGVSPLASTVNNPSTQQQGLQSVGVNGSNVPLLPSGFNPIFGPNGTLVGYQQSPTTPPTTSNPVTTPPPTTPPIVPPDVSGGFKQPPVFQVPVTAQNPVPLPKPTLTPAQPQFTNYQVQHGDNLSSIAARFGTTWQAIYAVPQNRQLIGSNPNLIFAWKQPLLIPKGTGAGPNSNMKPVTPYQMAQMARMTKQPTQATRVMALRA